MKVYKEKTMNFQDRQMLNAAQIIVHTKNMERQYSMFKEQEERTSTSLLRGQSDIAGLREMQGRINMIEKEISELHLYIEDEISLIKDETRLASIPTLLERT